MTTGVPRAHRDDACGRPRPAGGGALVTYRRGGCGRRAVTRGDGSARRRRWAAVEPEGAEREPSGEEEREPLAMSSSLDHHGQPLAAAELDPTEAPPEEEPLQEDADCSPGQLPPGPAEEAGHAKSYCQAWLLAPLEDARFLICCTNWY